MGLENKAESLKGSYKRVFIAIFILFIILWGLTEWYYGLLFFLFPFIAFIFTKKRVFIESAIGVSVLYLTPTLSLGDIYDWNNIRRIEIVETSFLSHGARHPSYIRIYYFSKKKNKEIVVQEHVSFDKENARKVIDICNSKGVEIVVKGLF